MKSKSSLIYLCAGLLTLPVSGRATAFYVNDGVVNCPPQIPPQIDAINFVNNNFFSINFTNFSLNPIVYKTANTLNYTNNGQISGNQVFQFDTGPLSSGPRRMAANFVNSGTISVGSVFNTNILFFGLSKLLISATNVINPGTNIVGVDGLLQISGEKVDLSRGALNMEGFDSSALFDFVGIFTRYWGISTNIINPFVNFENSLPTTPVHPVTNAGGAVVTFEQLQLPLAVPYVSDVFTSPTSRVVLAVFLSNTNAAITNNVYFTGPASGNILVEWRGFSTNQISGEVTTNFLYLEDNMNFVTPLDLITNSVFGNIGASYTAQPNNFFLSRTRPFIFGTPAVAGLPTGTFNNSTVTNQYAAWGVTLAPTTQLPSGVAGGQITNLPGRIEITSGDLNLNLTRISGLNYMRLKGTNHFVGTSNARISVPVSDIELASTNGSLVITNLLSPAIARITGDLNLWAARWTNAAAGVTTRYHVLFVDSQMSPTAPALVQDLVLRSKNNEESVVIADELNVTRSLLIDAARLTLTTNRQPAATITGELNIQSAMITWSTSTPRLQYLTNAGAITSPNAVFFGGSRSSPFYTSNFNEPYLAFVNSGLVRADGSLIWADYFENSGIFTTGFGFGAIELQSQLTVLTNGSFFAGKGDVTISTSDLVVSNHVIQAGNRLNLAIANSVTDMGVSNVNTWLVGKGMNLLVKPVTGDLLGTTVLETAAQVAENVHLWAGEDRSCSPSGYMDNAAIGQLILDGAADSLFTFRGTGEQNAIYVDHLELRNYTTNIDFNGNFVGIQVDPNMKVYFAQATANGASIAERLNGANGGRFCWVSDYAGIYSSTNLVYPDGSTNVLNAALVQSCNLDSDGDGLPNCIDPTPILRSQDLVLSVVMTNSPSYGAVLSWQTAPFSTNSVYFKSAIAGQSWQVLTNVVRGVDGGTVTVFDPVGTNVGRMYRVLMNAPKP